MLLLTDPAFTCIGHPLQNERPSKRQKENFSGYDASVDVIFLYIVI